jgi:hypothetical protein
MEMNEILDHITSEAERIGVKEGAIFEKKQTQNRN